MLLRWSARLGWKIGERGKGKSIRECISRTVCAWPSAIVRMCPIVKCASAASKSCNFKCNADDDTIIEYLGKSAENVFFFVR